MKISTPFKCKNEKILISLIEGENILNWNSITDLQCKRWRPRERPNIKEKRGREKTRSGKVKERGRRGGEKIGADQKRGRTPTTTCSG